VDNGHYAKKEDNIWLISKKKKKKTFMLRVGRDSSVGIATGYGVGGLGIESRWRRVLPHLFRQALGAIQPPVEWVPGLSRG